MDAAEEIRRFAEGKLSKGQFIVDVIISSRKGPKKILVIVDGDNGVNIDECADLSRELSKWLDEASLIEENFTLEVSTPGVDYPLKLKRQYIKHIGRSLRVKQGDRTTEGKLTEVSDDKITLVREVGTGKKKETKNIEIPFTEIDKAFVLVSFK
ncbi:ribosome maturation factor RimP [Chryseosolibacter indicus]|uniref:Ribosome maturation factor RimP n=1 Tax=Chryseosolibacter indicus TaxID=2782351 RepID=A0ABS5VX75_9BACT|nr:ribosome maturation factor RimP [Chryseosolibacter indicus]MBT1705455.1 ribosome maturation factor RimP [Chryseosolibacter indicus]